VHVALGFFTFLSLGSCKGGEVREEGGELVGERVWRLCVVVVLAADDEFGNSTGAGGRIHLRESVGVILRVGVA
jgi:hypothetical protein